MGVLVAIATGRSKANVCKYIQQLDLPQQFVPVVCYNGACGLLYERKEDNFVSNVVFSNALPSSSSEKLINFAEKHGYVLQVKALAVFDGFCNNRGVLVL